MERLFNNTMLSILNYVLVKYLYKKPESCQIGKIENSWISTTFQTVLRVGKGRKGRWSSLGRNGKRLARRQFNR